jgi:hypothetical protein
MISYSAESENGTIVAAYPNDVAYCPHVGVALSHLSGPENRPSVLVARLSPDDARAVAAAMQRSADHIQNSWDAYQAETKAGDTDD